MLKHSDLEMASAVADATVTTTGYPPDLENFIDQTIKQCLLQYDLGEDDTEAVLEDMERAWPGEGNHNGSDIKSERASPSVTDINGNRDATGPYKEWDASRDTSQRTHECVRAHDMTPKRSLSHNIFTPIGRNFAMGVAPASLSRRAYSTDDCNWESEVLNLTVSSRRRGEGEESRKEQYVHDNVSSRNIKKEVEDEQNEEREKSHEDTDRKFCDANGKDLAVCDSRVIKNGDCEGEIIVNTACSSEAELLDLSQTREGSDAGSRGSTPDSVKHAKLKSRLQLRYFGDRKSPCFDQSSVKLERTTPSGAEDNYQSYLPYPIDFTSERPRLQTDRKRSNRNTTIEFEGQDFSKKSRFSTALSSNGEAQRIRARRRSSPDRRKLTCEDTEQPSLLPAHRSYPTSPASFLHPHNNPSHTELRRSEILPDYLHSRLVPSTNTHHASPVKCKEEQIPKLAMLSGDYQSVPRTFPGRHSPERRSLSRDRRSISGHFESSPVSPHYTAHSVHEELEQRRAEESITSHYLGRFPLSSYQSHKSHTDTIRVISEDHIQHQAYAHFDPPHLEKNQQSSPPNDHNKTYASSPPPLLLAVSDPWRLLQLQRQREEQMSNSHRSASSQERFHPYYPQSLTSKHQQQLHLHQQREHLSRRFAHKHQQPLYPHPHPQYLQHQKQPFFPHTQQPNQSKHQHKSAPLGVRTANHKMLDPVCRIAAIIAEELQKDDVNKIFPPICCGRKRSLRPAAETTGTLK